MTAGRKPRQLKRRDPRRSNLGKPNLLRRKDVATPSGTAPGQSQPARQRSSREPEISGKLARLLATLARIDLPMGS
jgi:hypothetical protein